VIGERPVLVFLHGRGGDDPLFDAVDRLGTEDFAAHDVIANANALDGLPVWLDAGDEDPCRPGDDAFAAAVARATVRTWPGGHDRDYWDAHWGEYLRFHARALRRC
jgi:hypothetical protein